MSDDAADATASEMARRITHASLDSNELGLHAVVREIPRLSSEVRLDITARLRLLAAVAGGEPDFTDVLPDDVAERFARLGRDAAGAALVLAHGDREVAKSLIDEWFPVEPEAEDE